MLLSLIIPFFNSEKSSKRLLEKLAIIKEKDIEFILVNDGSTDDTWRLLQEFKASLPNSNINLISQHNKGPGGARNSGLKVAKGKYVWFVDSDDDITKEALEVIRKNCDVDYDFIDFNVIKNKILINSMSLSAGEYKVTECCRFKLINSFGPISSKAVRRKFLLDNNILYPEYCFYEDNQLGFIYPLLVQKFMKTEVVGYLTHVEFDSITRNKLSLKSLDRLHTAEYGFREGLKLAKNDAEVTALEKKFIDKYLTITTIKFFRKIPNKNWIVVCRVMNQYRRLAKELKIKSSVIEALNATDYNYKVKSYFISQWAASFLILGDQTVYFEKLHKKAWK